jgi:ParB family chromosome partitioning protein
MARKALGRGLDALIPRGIPEEEHPRAEAKQTAPVDQILPNPWQPRRLTDPAKMDELVRSVEAHGVLEPLLVRKVGETFELVAGERRLRAAQRAGMKEVPIIIVEVDDKMTLEMALIENLQREDLNPVDEARAYQKLVDEFGRTHDEIAAEVSKDRSTITNLLRILRLPPDVLALLADGQLSVGHARAVLGLESAQGQLRWARQIVAGNWSVRETEQRIAARSKGASKGEGGARVTVNDPHLRRVEEAIKRRVGTEVHLSTNKRGGGKLVLRYESQEDLERVLDILEVQVH